MEGISVKCPECNNNMTLLLVSYVCDYCDGIKEKTKLKFRRKARKLKLNKDILRKTIINDADGLP